MCDNRKRTNVRYFEVNGRIRWKQGIKVVTSQRDASINNSFNYMFWKRILLKDFIKILEIPAETQPGVIDLVSSINDSPSETQFLRIGCKTKVIANITAS